MGTIKLLKEAILEKDWDKVKEFYAEFTGEELVEEQKQKPTKKEYSEDYIHVIGKRTPLKKQTTIDPETGEVKNIASFEPVNPDKIKTVGNLWSPDEYIDSIPASERQEHENTKYKPKTKKLVKNKPFTLSKVICRNCNKQYEVHPIYAKENYICDKCIKTRISS